MSNEITSLSQRLQDRVAHNTRAAVAEAILTARADALKAFHDRMPAIVGNENMLQITHAICDACEAIERMAIDAALNRELGRLAKRLTDELNHKES